MVTADLCGPCASFLCVCLWLDNYVVKLFIIIIIIIIIVMHHLRAQNACVIRPSYYFNVKSM